MSTVLSASSIIGDHVRNPEGEALGKVHDLMIDTARADVRYAVVSFGGFLGMGDKLFAIPLEAMTVDLDAHEFVLDVSKERLEEAPGFDKDNWPSEIGGDWGRTIYTFYGITYPA